MSENKTTAKHNSINNNVIKGVVFDMDGVIFDTEKLYTIYWMQAAREAGFAMLPQHVLDIRSLSAAYAKPKLQAIFGEDFPYEQIRDRRRELFAKHLNTRGIEKKSGLDTLLHYLHEKHYRTAIATATNRSRTEACLEQAGIAGYFDECICGDMVTKGKPDPEIYLTACRALDLPPEACIALEDSPYGVLSAYRAGCRVVMIPDLSGPDAALRRISAACVPDLSCVIALLEL